jgi:prophage regulatory protein
MNTQLEPLYRLKELVGYLKISRSSIYSGIKDGTFPAPMRLGKRTVAWSQQQIEDWLSNRQGV